MTHNLFVIDDQHPEDLAMMCALYSRSASSVTNHLEKVKKTGSGKFMESYYVGYGHESIGDCASTTIFIENVSILAAKAIQDWPLYSGQETSTRYIDMSKQEMTDPIGTIQSAEILKNWRDFYLSSQEPLIAHLKDKYPKGEKESQNMYNKAIQARCFDILRAFLPAGIHTQLGWHTNLRQVANKLALMNHHPDPLIQALSRDIHNELKGKYAHSFNHKLYDETEKYRAQMVAEYTYFKNPTLSNNSHDGKPPHRKYPVVCTTTITQEDLHPYTDAIKNRPKKTQLPGFMQDLGQVTFDFFVDFGSFRDIQRHRNGVCRMPLLETNYGFHPWYLDQLPDSLRKSALELIDNQIIKINALKTADGLPVSDIFKQYFIALGFQVPCKVTYGLPATLYTIELRSGTTVHATLREVAHNMMYALKEKLPDLVFHVDLEADEWDVRRGLHDIKEKV